MTKLKIADLTPDDRNANRGTPRGEAMLERSLREYGAGRSILIDRNNRVIAGNKTLEQAYAIGLEDVEIVETDGHKLVAVKRTDIDLDTPKGRELALADNRVGQVSLDWDARILSELAEEVDVTKFWDEGEIDALLASINPPVKDDPGPQIDRAEELREKWQTARGQIWQVGRHRLMCGDSTSEEDVERLMGGQRAALMIADPPYNVGYEYANDEGDRKDKDDYAAFCRAFMSVGAQQAPTQIVTPGKVNARLYDYREYMTWFKGFGLSRGSFYRAMVTEPILLFGTKPKNKHFATDHFDIPTDRESGLRDLHTCPKPVALWSALIEPLTDRLAIIYEAFAGSGTAFVVCEQLERICYGIEISPAYVAVILERLSGMGLTPKLLDELDNYGIYQDSG